MNKEDIVLKPKIVPKPWGRELWLIKTDKYAMKFLEVSKGQRLSLQYHEKKEETWYVDKGKFKATVNEDTFEASVGDIIHLKPETVHRIEAIEDVRIIEVSTPELEDVVRLKDDYSRN